jgi:hypothetical protein
LCLKQARDLTRLGQHGAVENNHITMLNQDGRKVLNIQITDQISLILDINPHKLLLGVFRGQRFEAGAVLFADIAPGGAQASYDPTAFVQGTRQLRKCLGYQK